MEPVLEQVPFYGNGVPTPNDYRSLSPTERDSPRLDQHHQGQYSERNQGKGTAQRRDDCCPGAVARAPEHPGVPVEGVSSNPENLNRERVKCQLPRQEETTVDPGPDPSHSESADGGNCSCKWKSRGCSWEGGEEEREQHLDPETGNCAFALVECEFRSAGCHSKVLRKDLAKHNQEAAHRHLVLSSKVNEGKWEEIQRKLDEGFLHVQQQVHSKDEAVQMVSKALREWREEMRAALRSRDEQIKELEKQLAESRREIGSIRDELQSKHEHIIQLQTQLDVQDRHLVNIGVSLAEKDKQIEWFTGKIDGLTSLLQSSSVNQLHKRAKSGGSDMLDLDCIPFTFVLEDFTAHSRNATPWESSPFYTNPRGYKMCARVYANHRLLGEGTHISLFLYVLCGEFDDTLIWPRKLVISAEVLNYATGEWGLRKTHCNTWQNPHFFHQGGSGWPKFIAYSDLNSTKGVEYLRDDCICFRISSIKMA